MGIMFNADEIFEMAEEIERNGARFYRKAAEGTAKPVSKNLLLTLAAMEDKHLQVFTEMREELHRQKQAPDMFDPDKEAVEYLHEFAHGRVFDVKDDPSRRLTGKETFSEVLTVALQLEKDSIIFYLGLKELVPERLGQDRVRGIIKQEMTHVTLISRELAAAKA